MIEPRPLVYSKCSMPIRYTILNKPVGETGDKNYTGRGLGVKR
jgi:hypothetical protein